MIGETFFTEFEVKTNIYEPKSLRSYRTKAMNSGLGKRKGDVAP